MRDYVGSQTAAASVPIRHTCNSLRLRTSPRTERLQIAQFSPSFGELLSERDSDTMVFSAIYGTLVIHSVCGQLPEPSVFKQRSFLLHLVSSYQRGTATRWRFQPSSPAGNVISPSPCLHRINRMPTDLETAAERTVMELGLYQRLMPTGG